VVEDQVGESLGFASPTLYKILVLVGGRGYLSRHHSFHNMSFVTLLHRLMQQGSTVYLLWAWLQRWSTPVPGCEIPTQCNPV